MTFEELVRDEVRKAVHAALDEREANTLPPLYTLQQVEDYYGGELKASTLRALCKSGTLPYVRYGESRYYLTPEGLKEAIKRLTVQAKPKPITVPRSPKHARRKAAKKRLAEAK